MSEGSFECKVSGKRESANGIFLTLQIQPDDYTAELATLRVGSALMLGWAEVVNSAVEEIGFTASEIAQIANHGTELSPEAVGAKTPKDRKPFASLPLSQQCAIRCLDTEFQRFMVERSSGFDAYLPTPDNAITMVRERCKITSRSFLDDDTNHLSARNEWRLIEKRYQEWLTDHRYASVAR